MFTLILPGRVVHQPCKKLQSAHCLKTPMSTHCCNGTAPSGSLKQRCAAAEALLTQLFDELDAGKQPDWERLRGYPVARLEPTSWEDVVAIIQDGGEEALSRLGRIPPDIRRYRRYRAEVIAKSYASVTDYLYAKVFGLPTVPAADGRLAAVVPPDFGASAQIVWRDNDFPYALERGVEHHCLWASCPLTPAQLQAEVAKRREGYEFVMFVNPPALMSVPTIWHAHIMSRRAPDSQNGGNGAVGVAG